MAIYLDPPLWPAHGTLFSHLISDTSLAELHAFAEAAGIPDRAFDGDHYDVPERRYDSLVAAGAIPVEARILVRKLIASGLRIPARERNSSLKVPLLKRWNSVLPGHEALFLDLLGPLERTLTALTTAAPTCWPCSRRWTCSQNLPFRPGPCCLLPGSMTPFTTGFRGRTRKSPRGSPKLQLSEAGLPAAEWLRWLGLVRVTSDHRPAPEDDGGVLLCDADLSVLGSEPGQYARYVAAVRKDFAHVGDADFAAGRAAVVRHLLDLDPLFNTDRARELWLEAARRNLADELETSGH